MKVNRKVQLDHVSPCFTSAPEVLRGLIGKWRGTVFVLKICGWPGGVQSCRMALTLRGKHNAVCSQEAFTSSPSTAVSPTSPVAIPLNSGCHCFPSELMTDKSLQCSPVRGTAFSPLRPPPPPPPTPGGSAGSVSRQCRAESPGSLLTTRDCPCQE